MSDKPTVTLSQEQAQFLIARAEQQTSFLASPVHPSDLLDLAIAFYQEHPSLVENFFDWKGAIPFVWPRTPLTLPECKVPLEDVTQN